MEIWKDVAGYDGKYQVSNYGNVKSNSRWKKGALLKGGMCGNPGPYRFVVLVKSSRADAKNFYIHRLVAEHFLDNPNGYKEVNHKDGNTLNNMVDNLEWCSRKYNAEHASKTGLLSKSHEFETGAKNARSKPVLQIDKRGNVVKEWDSVNQIQRETTYLASSIFCCCNHRKGYKSAYGFRWEYKNGKTKNNDAETDAQNRRKQRI